jgi:serine/threonine protein kinase
MANPAQNLAGEDLGNGWKVIRKVDPGVQATGGHFSVGYIVSNATGREAFMKALDFSAAFQAQDVSRALQDMTSAYNFERDLLNKCRNRKMNRVVTPLADGNINVKGNVGPNNTVCYLIFELAEGDIRKHRQQMKQFDLAWCLRSLHNTAVGLSQLHKSGIAHQDLKPSNVLVFGPEGARVTDLGRASDVEVPFKYDALQCPGDMGYVPPEQMYGFRISDDFERRRAADMYLFGSLFFFFFCDVSATQAIDAKLKRQISMNLSNTSFDADLPYIRKAFNECLDDLRASTQLLAVVLTDDIVEIVSQLCDPDPRKRGERKRPVSIVSPFNLERYVSHLNLLAKKAEFGLVN